MDLAIGITILSLQLVIVGWLLAHSLQCSRFHERVAALEQWIKDQVKE